MQVLSNGKVRRSRAEWQEIISQCKRSGLGPREFCRREEIHLGSFLRWERKLDVPGGSNGFVPVTTIAPASASWMLEISLPNGCQLRFQG